MTLRALLAGMLSQAPPADKVTPGLLGFLVIAALGVVTYLLWRSMNRQLRKGDFGDRPEDSDEERPQPPPTGQP